MAFGFAPQIVDAGGAIADAPEDAAGDATKSPSTPKTRVA
jgi:hypothetical protein